MRNFRSAAIIRDSAARDRHSSCIKPVAQGVRDVTAATPHFAWQPDCKATWSQSRNCDNGAAAVDSKWLGAHGSTHGSEAQAEQDFWTTGGANTNTGSQIRSFFGSRDDHRDPTCLSHCTAPASCPVRHIDESHDCRDWVLPMLELLFSSDRFFNSENDANKAPVQIHLTWF